jgi:hypothetical protein
VSFCIDSLCATTIWIWARQWSMLTNDAAQQCSE